MYRFALQPYKKGYVCYRFAQHPYEPLYDAEGEKKKLF
jgi:hypothetical protein